MVKKVVPKVKPPPKRPATARVKGWFKQNVTRFKKKLKKFGGDWMTYLAKMKPPGVPEAKEEEIPTLGAYIKSIDQLG